MAPEVIEHKPYGERADIFSFGILLWELLTGRVPYEDMTPLQAAVGVVQKGLRPSIPPGTPGPLAAVMAACWVRDPESRPSFEQLREQLEDILEGARADDMRRQNAGGLPGRGCLQTCTCWQSDHDTSVISRLDLNACCWGSLLIALRPAHTLRLTVFLKRPSLVC